MKHDRYSNVLLSQGTQSSTCREKTIVFNLSVFKLDISQPCRSQKTQNPRHSQRWLEFSFSRVSVQSCSDSECAFSAFNTWSDGHSDVMLPATRCCRRPGIPGISSLEGNLAAFRLSASVPATSIWKFWGDRFEVLPARRRLNRSVAVTGQLMSWARILLDIVLPWLC